MTKKSLKTTRQILMLKRYLQERPDKWPKEEVIRLAKEIHLSRPQVYKWLWDQRNLIRELQKKEAETPFSSFLQNNLGLIYKEKFTSKQRVSHKLKEVILKYDCRDYVISVPQEIEFAVNVKIPISTEEVFKNLLREEGCQMIKIRTDKSFDTPEKKPKQAEISDFSAVQEED